MPDLSRTQVWGLVPRTAANRCLAPQLPTGTGCYALMDQLFEGSYPPVAQLLYELLPSKQLLSPA